MDVRCEKCQTEYELDESRLKPGGVTVKCTQCGHMFKIRMRTATNGAVGPGGNGAPDPDRTRQITGGRAASSSGVPRAATSDFGSGPSAERMWIIRLDNGETRTCRELGTLQQWILSGLVTRESLISRTGKTWKRLGDIAELASFFQVADEARFQRAGRDSARVTSPQSGQGAGAPPAATQLGGPPSSAAARPPAAAAKPPAQAPTAPRKTLVGTAAAPREEVTQPRAPSPVIPAPASAADVRVTAPLPTRPAPEPPPSVLATPPPSSSPPRPSNPPPVPSIPPQRPGATPHPARADAQPVPSMPSLARVASPVSPSDAAPGPSGPVGGIAAVGERSTGAWASADVKPMTTGAWASADVKPIEGDGPVGPIGGAIRSVAAEPAFANSGRIPPVPPESPRSFGGDLSAIPGAVFGEETSPVLPPRRGVGRWIAIGSLIVIAIAGGVVYATVFRASPAAVASIDAGSDGDGGLDGDAGAVVATIADAAVAAPSDALVAAQAALLADTGPGLVAAAQAIAADTSPAAIATHARLLTAIAQSLEDEAALAPAQANDKKRAEQLRRDAKQRLLEAVKPAQRAVDLSQKGADQPLAHIAMADLLRQQGKPAADVKRHLDRARALAPDDRELRLVTALLALREGKTADAKSQLEALDRGAGALEQSGDVRPRFRLAVIAQAAGDAAAARAAAEAVLAAAENHAAARALIARLGESAADPLPPEEPTAGQTPTPTPTPTSGSGTTPAPSGDSGGDSYDKVLAQANKAAEVDCGKAMPLYEKAIDLRPSGVEALSGAGYCHVDNKEFASAHAKFRAALAVSPRFERALWGIAEAYQQQGRSDLAIEAYRRYLEVYPDSAQAKRQLDKLGGGAPEPKPDPKPEPSAPAPDPGGAAEPSPSPPPSGSDGQ
jgi:predicted Zn finger-like uncharacterized protein